MYTKIEDIKIREIHLGEDDQVIYLTNGDCITSSDGYGASYNNNYELSHQFCLYANTDVFHLEKDSIMIEEFKSDANDYLECVMCELDNEEIHPEDIEEYKLKEFKDSFKVLKVIKF